MITQSKYFISDFLNIQRNSFQSLLKQGLIDEFLLRNPISDSYFEVFFYPEYYRLTTPQWNIREAILKGKTYSSKLYMPVQFTDKKNKQIILKWIFMGEIPIMTNRGYFIFNGAPRVVVNQLIRSPGLYYQEKKINLYATHKDEKPFATLKRFYADFICLRGTWLRIEIDKEKNIWAQFKKARKIPLLWFLHAMGLSQAMIFKNVCFPERLLSNFEKEENISEKKLELNSNKMRIHKGEMDHKKKGKSIKTPPEAWRKIVELLKLQKDPPLRTKNTIDFSESQKTFFSLNESQLEQDSLSLNVQYSETEKEVNNHLSFIKNTQKHSLGNEDQKTNLLELSLGEKQSPIENLVSHEDQTDTQNKRFESAEKNRFKKDIEVVFSSLRQQTKTSNIELNEKKTNHIFSKSLKVSDCETIGITKFFEKATNEINIYNESNKNRENTFKNKENKKMFFQDKKKKNVSINSQPGLILSELQENLAAALFTKQSNILLQKGFPSIATKSEYSSSLNIENQSEIESEELGRKWIYNKFMNSRNYDLGKQGRDSFNRKLGLNISPLHTTLTAQDVLYATDYLLKVERGIKNVDDIDHLMNRKIRTSGELIQMQIGLSLVRLEKTIREKLKNHLTQIDNNLILQFEKKEIETIELETTNLVQKREPLESISQNILTDLKAEKTILDKDFVFVRSNRSDSYRIRLDKDEVFMKSDSVKLQKKVENKQNAKNNRRLGSSQVFFDGLISGTVVNFNEINKTQLKNKQFIQSQKNDLERLANGLINSKILNGTLREFFGTNPLSQFMDQMNPLAEITHKRRLSSMGPGGVGRENAPMAIRSIHPTHYGRICPIETPEGKNTGLVNSLTTCAQVTYNGFIETPFYKVYKGQVQKSLGIFYLNTEQEEKLKSAPADLTISNIGFLPKSNIPVRIATEFTKIKRNQVQFIGVSPIQMISVATSLIPFLEHDDANRALMGSNMQRQAVPIIKPQRPIVGTGLEARTASDSGHILQTKKSGFVAYVSADKIIIYSIFE